MVSSEAEKHIPKFWFSKRFLIAIFMFFGNLHIISMKGNLNIAIVAMTSITTIKQQNETIVQEPEFNWDSKTKGFILSVYAYGFGFAIFGSHLSLRFGGSTMIGVALGSFASITLLLPTIVRFNFYLFLLLRSLEGLCEGLEFTSVNEFWSRWSPVQDRSKMMSIAYCGLYVGYAVVYPLCGIIIQKFGCRLLSTRQVDLAGISFSTGFFQLCSFAGCSSLIWCLIWVIFVPNHPSSDRWITEAELAYIKDNITQCKRPKKMKTVWKSIFTSKCIWALWISKFSFTLANTIIVTCMPMYIKDVINVRIDKIGFYSALPSILCIFILPMSGYIVDYIQNKKLLIPTQTHKAFMCTGFIVGAVPLLCISLFHLHFTTTMICFVIAKVTLCLSFIILQMGCVCMAPQCASLVAGSFSTVLSIGFVAAPMLVGFIVTNHSPEEWDICIAVTGIVLIIGAAIYLLFGSAEPQPWSYSIQENQLQREQRI